MTVCTYDSVYLLPCSPLIVCTCDSVYLWLCVPVLHIHVSGNTCDYVCVPVTLFICECGCLEVGTSVGVGGGMEVRWESEGVEWGNLPEGVLGRQWD